MLSAEIRELNFKKPIALPPKPYLVSLPPKDQNSNLTICAYELRCHKSHITLWYHVSFEKTSLLCSIGKGPLKMITFSTLLFPELQLGTQHLLTILIFPKTRQNHYSEIGGTIYDTTWDYKKHKIGRVKWSTDHLFLKAHSHHEKRKATFRNYFRPLKCKRRN